jgi:hypothetical protein
MNIKIIRKNNSKNLVNLKQVTNVLVNEPKTLFELKNGQDTIGIINADTQVTYFASMEHELKFDEIEEFLLHHMGE